MSPEEKLKKKDEELKANVAARQFEIDKLTEVINTVTPHLKELTADQLNQVESFHARVQKLEEENRLDRAFYDFNEFAEFVSVDDETGEPIRQAPIHRKWAELADQHDRLIIWSHVAAGKSTQLSILRTTWELGRDPTLRFCILSNTASIATKIVKAIASFITGEKVPKIFPNLKQHPEGPWTTTELKVITGNDAKDPSVRAVGLHGALTSARVDRLVVDDILDLECVDTAKNRQKVSQWYTSTAVGRLTKRAKILIVGNAWHPDDLLHELSKKPGFKWVKFPVIYPDGRISWPEAWPKERIEKAKADMGPAEFARAMLCKSRDDDESRFKQEWINQALKAGNGLRLIESIDEIPESEREGCAVITGVDLAVGKKAKNDRTVFFTFLENAHGHRRLLKIKAGKFTAPTIIEEILYHHRAFGSILGVEDNGAQDFLIQFSREISNIPITNHTTTRAKHDAVLGVEGLAIELSNGKWTIPNDNGALQPEVTTWINEMLFYTPKAHTGDTLMASYIARETARKVLGNRSMPSVSMRALGSTPISNKQKPSTEGEQPQVTSLLQRLFAT